MAVEFGWKHFYMDVFFHSLIEIEGQAHPNNAEH
jgi:hypothetical protein